MPTLTISFNHQYFSLPVSNTILRCSLPSAWAGPLVWMKIFSPSSVCKLYRVSALKVPFESVTPQSAPRFRTLPVYHTAEPLWLWTWLKMKETLTWNPRPWKSPASDGDCHTIASGGLAHVQPICQCTVESVKICQSRWRWRRCRLRCG